jgi:protein O-mannosyl-transferase
VTRLVAGLRRLAAWPGAPFVVGALAFAVYAGTLGHGFVYDDGRQILDNPWIWNPGEWKYLLTKPVWSFLDERATGFYRPVQTMVHAAAGVVSGHNPIAFHVAAVLMHALASAMALVMLRRVTGPARALAAAALFAAWPIHAEAVAWVSAGPDVNLAAFLFLALALGSRARAAPRPMWPALAAGGAALVAYFAKETAVVAPILMATMPEPASRVAGAAGRAAAGALRGARLRSQAIVAAAFVVPLAIYLAARSAALGGLVAMEVRPKMEPWMAAGTALALVPRYLALAFVPWRMVPDRVVDPAGGPLDPAALLGAGIIVAAIVAWLGLRRKAPAAGWALVLLFVPLAPALVFVRFAHTLAADRYLYIPSAGVCLLLAEALGWTARRGRAAAGVARAATRDPAAPSEAAAGGAAAEGFAVAVCALIIAVGAIMAARAAAMWHDSETLGRAGIALEPRSIVMRLELIHALDAAGRTDEALAEARAAAAVAPGDRWIGAALANVEARVALRDGGDAVAIYQAAVAADPLQAVLWSGLSAALLRAGRPAEAIDAAERALAIDRFNRVALVNLGTARGDTGDVEGQEREARRLIAIDSESAGGWLNLGAALLRRGDLDGAREALSRSASLDPTSARAEIYLSWLAAKRGEHATALERARRATKLDPKDAEAWNRLGAEEAAAGDLAAARAAWETTVALAPGHAGATENLRRLQERQKR